MDEQKLGVRKNLHWQANTISSPAVELSSQWGEAASSIHPLNHTKLKVIRAHSIRKRELPCV